MKEQIKENMNQTKVRSLLTELGVLKADLAEEKANVVFPINAAYREKIKKVTAAIRRETKSLGIKPVFFPKQLAVEDGKKNCVRDHRHYRCEYYETCLAVACFECTSSSTSQEKYILEKKTCPHCSGVIGISRTDRQSTELKLHTLAKGATWSCHECPMWAEREVEA